LNFQFQIVILFQIIHR